MTTTIEQRPQETHLLGRHLEHDSRSRAFALPVTVDRSTWRTKSIRIYDPTPNPNQSVGNCTMCAKAMQLNSVGNRRTGHVLDMRWAMTTYTWETANDEFEGAYPPDDTGSSGLASCKTAQQYGWGGEYRWLFGGADEVIQAVMDGQVISVGTWWYYDMFEASGGWFNSLPIVKVTGGQAGGHQWPVRGYDLKNDRVLGRCWWGTFRDFWISRADLDSLLRDGGDAHFQRITS